MKFTFILLSIAIVSFAECSPKPYFENIPIVGTVISKTSQVRNYVRDKGRSLKNYYNNVRDEFKYYFGMGVEDDNYEGKSLVVTTTDKDTDVTNSEPEHINLQDANVHMTTPQLIALNDYLAESHIIVTDDGYILTVHRIPYSKYSKLKLIPRKTVLLHHGILGSSADWILTGPKKGLGYILSDAGYDVWMANVRGNTYSRAHISRYVNSYAFWNFTFHEVGQYDLPAVIDYIIGVKGKEVKIDYIGFSMGTTVLFSLLSTKTEYNDVLNAAYALAPIAYMSDVRSPLHLLSKYSNKLEYLMNLLGADEFLPQNELVTRLSKYAYKFESNDYKGVFYKNLFFVLCGYDEKQFNKSLVPLILDHVPAGASTKTLVHYAQEIGNQGKFRQFDYGLMGNLKQYGTRQPPEYPVDKITLPIALISGNNDWLSGKVDVNKLYAELPNPIENYRVPYEDFNHIDFIWGVDAPTLVYDKLLQLLENFKRDEFFNGFR